MKKELLIFLINFLFILSTAFGEIEVKTSLGISGEWKINRWCPLFIQIKNLGSKISLNIDVVFTQGLRFAGSSKTIYKEKVEIPSLSTRTLELLLPPIDFRYPIEIKITSEDKSINFDKKIEYNLERIVLPLILIIGEPENLPFSLPPKTRVVNVIDEKFLPTNYKAYDCVDYIFVDYNFWKNLSLGRKNALRLFRAFDERIFFFEEIPRIKNSINLASERVQFFPPSFLESPDLSIIEMQRFSFPSRFKIGIFLLSYFLLLYILRRFLNSLKIFPILISILLISSIVTSIFLGLEFKNDALIFGERGLLYLPYQRNIGELFSHFIFFSPFKRNISLSLPSNAIQIYQPFYQPQKAIGPLEIDKDKEKISLSLERNRPNYIEILSLVAFPLQVSIKEEKNYVDVEIENNTEYKISELRIIYNGKEEFLGDIDKNQKEKWKFYLDNLKTEDTSQFYSLISKWRIKSDIIKNRKIILWGKIENSLVNLKIEGVKSNSKSENIIFIPLK